MRRYQTEAGGVSLVGNVSTLVPIHRLKGKQHVTRERKRRKVCAVEWCQQLARVRVFRLAVRAGRWGSGQAPQTAPTYATNKFCYDHAA